MTTPYSAANSAKAMHDDAAPTVGQQELGDVLEVLRDGVRGYTKLAEDLETDWAAVIEEIRTRRQATLDTVVTAAAEMGYRIEESGSLAGAFHRAWIGVREALGGDGSVIEAAIDGDEHALEELDEALSAEIPETLADVFRAAREDVQLDLTSLDSLTMDD